MWDYYAKRAIEFGHPFDGINSPFAFPRLPPKAYAPLGISGAGTIKDAIIQDRDLTMNRLNNHHEMFHRYAMGLFNFSPNRLSPGHPMGKKEQIIEDLREENKRLRQENAVLKTGSGKEKKTLDRAL